MDSECNECRLASQVEATVWGRPLAGLERHGMEASAQVIIERPVDEVYAFATDIDYFERWILGVSEPRWLSNPPYRPHAEFEVDFVYAGVPLRFVFEVEEYRKNALHIIEALAGPASVHVEMAFDGGVESTRVRRSVEVKLAPMPLPIVETLGFLAKPALAARIKADLIRLKQCIEGTAVTPGLTSMPTA